MGLRNLAVGIFAMLAICFAQAGFAQNQDSKWTPIWDAEGAGKADPVWSEPYYAVKQDAVRMRAPLKSEAGHPNLSRKLDEAYRIGIHTYLQRVSHMIAGMNLPDDTTRYAECDDMAKLLSDDFVHTEGRENPATGFVIRTKDQLITACHNRAFLMDGFYALVVRGVATAPDEVQLTTCYYHDQWNDPSVLGRGETLLINGVQRQTVPRASVETIKIDQHRKKGLIKVHVALDVNLEMIRGGCQTPYPPIWKPTP